jgi:hypothetical protein
LEAQRLSKNGGNVEDRARRQNSMGDLSAICLKGNIMFKTYRKKSNHRVVRKNKVDTY